MYFKKIIGYTSSSELCKNINKGLLDTYTPPTVVGNNYKQWITENDPKVCYFCGLMQGQVYSVSETPFPPPPLHTRCRCRIEKMQAIIAGNATKDGLNGADYELRQTGQLPNYYITPDELKKIRLERWKEAFKICPRKDVYPR